MHQLKYNFFFFTFLSVFVGKSLCTSQNNYSSVTLSTTYPSFGTKMDHHGERSVTNLLDLWKSYIYLVS